MSYACISVDSPVGRLWIVEKENAIVRLTWREREETAPTDLLEDAADQLGKYFAGELQNFELPLNPAGGDFQQKVHQAMLEIPYGETQTYGDIAEKISGAAQPVGTACGRNPIPVIIPCHRVVAAKNLGGFSGEGGIETKIQLLRLENAIPYLI